MGLPRAEAAIAIVGVAVMLGGCVVDDARTRELREERERAEPVAPQDPVASPVVRGTTASRVSVAIESLGSISYDGLTVPQVSPDGQFVAMQDAPAPTRSQRLALEAQGESSTFANATVSITPLNDNIAGLRQRLEIFDLQAPIILGRDSGAQGVLVESPRPDGSRWIGVAQWRTDEARIRWLVRDRAVASHAVFAEAGALLYSERAIGGSRWSLVLRQPDGAERRLSLPDASLVYPLMAPDLRHATCMAVDDSGAISWLLIDLSAGVGDAVGRVVRRFDLASTGGMVGASQIVAASQSALHGLDRADAMNASQGTDLMPPLGPIIFHPAMDRCVALDAPRRTLVALAPGSVAAVDAGDGRVLCSTPQGLVLWTPGPQVGRGTTTRVLSEDYLPRRTASADRPFVLFAPMRRSATDLMVFGLAPAPAP